jgi:hypothetical protein
VSTGTQPDRKKLSLSDAIMGSGEDLQDRIVAGGPGGIGKTLWATYSEKPFFILSPGETGLHTLMRAGIASKEIPSVEVLQWLQVFDILEELRTAKHSRETVVVDAIDGIWKLAEDHELKTTFKGDNSANKDGYNCYAAGSRHTTKLPWQQFLMALDKLHRELKMQIILLAHTDKVLFRNPTGDDFDRLVPAMYKDAWAATYNWSDITMYMDRVITTKKGKGEHAKAKGDDVGAREMLTEYGICHDAKNRHNLPPVISMGESGQEAWENFTKALEEGRKS